jgi:hypothetical protein
MLFHEGVSWSRNEKHRGFPRRHSENGKRNESEWYP